jgi:ATP-binding cassette subfamily A (ABC1) protein 3
MEEADALSDRIGIVSSRMLAVGGRDELKKRVGGKIHVHLVSASAPNTSPQELQDMKNWISTSFEGSNVKRETSGGQVRFEVNETEGVGSVMRKIEASKEELGIEFYSVGKATLDEVFEGIVRRYGGEDVVERFE